MVVEAGDMPWEKWVRRGGSIGKRSIEASERVAHTSYKTAAYEAVQLGKHCQNIMI